MADPIRVNLKSDPSKYVEIKPRWTYADKVAVMEAKEQLGLAMLHRVVVGRNFEEPADLADLDDEDGEAVVDAIVKARREQLGDLIDPN